MAKKKAAKKVSKVEESEAVEAKEVDESKYARREVMPSASVEEETELPESEFEEIEISLPCRIKLKRTIFHPGIHKVPRHMAKTLLEIADKKSRADLSVFTGRSFVAEKLTDRALIIKNRSVL